MSTEQPKFEDIDPEIYERRSVGIIFGKMAQVFLEHMHINKGDRVLDVACGTGIVARLAAQKVGVDGSVTGLDINAGMLELAKSLAATDGAVIEWHEGDAADMPFKERDFDVVMCQQGLQFFPDKSAALSEMYRVLVDGGRLGICVWKSTEHNPHTLARAEALARHVSQAAGDKERRRPHFSLGDAERLQEYIEGAGFKNLKVYGLELEMNLGPPEKAVSVGSFSELEEEVAYKVTQEVREALRPYTSAEGVIVPGRFHLALAQK